MPYLYAIPGPGNLEPVVLGQKSSGNTRSNVVQVTLSRGVSSLEQYPLVITRFPYA